MKYVNLTKVPKNVKETDVYQRCITKGGDYISGKNQFDEAFENFFRCNLISSDIDWFLEFTDEEYTWFVLKWC